MAETQQGDAVDEVMTFGGDARIPPPEVFERARRAQPTWLRAL